MKKKFQVFTTWSVYVIALLLLAGCTQKSKKRTELKGEVNSVEEIKGSIEEAKGEIAIGEMFTLYELPYAYDHSIIFNPKDNQWHLFGIIADNKEFIHLTADSLTQRGWKKQESFRYKNREIWAPHIIEEEGLFYMFYTSIGVPREIRYSVSKDLYNWESPSEEPLFAFSNEHTNNMKNKDPMVFKEGDQWIMYYSMLKDATHWVVGYSTSSDLLNWSDPKICFDEHTEVPGVESPFVVKRGEYYYLTLSARPWPHGAQEFFRSKSPYLWKTSDLVHREDPWHAAEIIRDLDGKWYYSRSSGSQDDFRLAPLYWNDGLEKAETSMPTPKRLNQ